MKPPLVTTRSLWAQAREYDAETFRLVAELDVPNLKLAGFVQRHEDDRSFTNPLHRSRQDHHLIATDPLTLNGDFGEHADPQALARIRYLQREHLRCACPRRVATRCS